MTNNGSPHETPPPDSGHINPMAELAAYRRESDRNARHNEDNVMDRINAMHDAPKPATRRMTRKEKFGKHVIAPLALATAVTGTVVVAAQPAAHTVKNTLINNPFGSDPESLPIAEVTTGHPLVDEAFQEAASVDTCDTKVSAQDLITTYNQVFGGEDLSKLSKQLLIGESEKSITAINDSRSGLTFVKPPADMQKLTMHEDDQSISVNEYEKSLQSFMGGFNVAAQFHWTPAQAQELAAYIRPASKHDLAASAAIRQDVVATIIDFENAPKELVESAGLKKVLTGSVDQANDAEEKGIAMGEVVPGDPAILLDATHLGSPENAALLEQNRDLLRKTPGHEFGHVEFAAFCDGALSGYVQNDDTAFSALAGNFNYGQDAANSLEAGQKAGNYVALDSKHLSGPKEGEPLKGKVAVVDAYAANSTEEANADMTADIMDSTDLQELFDTKNNEQIIKNQLVLLLARIQKRVPEAGQFYAAQVRAAWLANEVSNRISEFNTQHPISPTSTYTPQNPYSAIDSKLIGALAGPNQILGGSA